MIKRIWNMTSRVIAKIISKFIVNRQHLTIVTTSVKQSEKNFKHNIEVYAKKNWSKNNALIYDQGDFSKYKKDPFNYSQEKDEAIFMKCCNNRDLSEVGCGLVAIHNAGILMDDPVNLCDVIRFFEHNDGFVLNGMFGLNPCAIKMFYDENNVSYNIYTKIAELEGSRDDRGVYIVCQWNDINDISRGAHFYAVSEKNGVLIPYNGAGNYSPSLSKTYNDFTSMLSKCPDKTGDLICAYKFFNT